MTPTHNVLRSPSSDGGRPTDGDGATGGTEASRGSSPCEAYERIRALWIAHEKEIGADSLYSPHLMMQPSWDELERSGMPLVGLVKEMEEPGEDEEAVVVAGRERGGRGRGRGPLSLSTGTTGVLGRERRECWVGGVGC